MSNYIKKSNKNIFCITNQTREIRKIHNNDIRNLIYLKKIKSLPFCQVIKIASS